MAERRNGPTVSGFSSTRFKTTNAQEIVIKAFTYGILNSVYHIIKYFTVKQILTSKQNVTIHTSIDRPISPAATKLDHDNNSRNHRRDPNAQSNAQRNLIRASQAGVRCGQHVSKTSNRGQEVKRNEPGACGVVAGVVGFGGGPDASAPSGYPLLSACVG